MPPDTHHPKVFISYSHDSLEHSDRVREVSDRLRADGIDCNIDQYEVSPAEGWPLWMEKQIRDAEFDLMVCTETYHRRVMKEEEPGKGLGLFMVHIIAVEDPQLREIEGLQAGQRILQMILPVPVGDGLAEAFVNEYPGAERGDEPVVALAD